MISALIDKVVLLSIAVTVALVESVVFFTISPILTVVTKFCVASTNLFAVVAVVAPESTILEKVTVSPSIKFCVSSIIIYCIF